MALNFMDFVGAIPGNVALGLIWGIMAIGVFVTFKILNFADLTVDGSFATGGATAVMLILNGWSAPLALLAAFVVGAVAGLCTGFLHTMLGIPDILSGILMQIALYSINLNIMGGANKAISVDQFKLIVSQRYLNTALLISLCFVVVVILLCYWYFGTEQGCAIRATGNNPAMSRAQGININMMKVIALAISNGLVAMAGGLLSQFQGYSDINMGRGSIVIGLAAVIIGEVLGSAIFGKRMNFMIRLGFVVVGAIIYYLVIGLVLWLQMPTDDLKLFTAIIVAVFLAIPYIKGKAGHSFAAAARKGAKND
ncbi:putative ABC transport system permease protein [Lachnospiraceae bacterium C10]|jgi:putative ABC transport system permease protein|nr:putative ABC transport system permease protein [Lachnospiraceae bacterium C10]SDW22883.1 putative ABC transport system permease protein [Lachnospiraceae bacterium KHCPX20]